MSSVNYSLNNRGVRLVSAEDAWVRGKNGNFKLNSSYRFVGKIDTRMSNMVLSVADKKKPKYRGDVSSLNRTAKSQIVDHFYDDKGKRNRRTVAYFAIEKKRSNKTGGKKK